jgi:hypothetical protein
MKPIKEFIVIYNIQTRYGRTAQTYKTFQTARKSFEFFWKNNTKSPMITADELMGGFTFRNLQGFKSREEGKEFAYADFLEYVKEYRK